ncbi:FG-GAP-like repeat-containing protein [Hymenobacter latericus]|uniref:FG-GAP-like repeat-containing protein n=1 Tax=Hymenobacter sp. YIM 151858-1 TaxID=2987688 RepID=UPI0022275670|nr:FG-GAP-like repeat-containing protein [Hymenobacter sp. YIM 151858-1]UYZ59808.1 FG-GAP-like repeat-containing protein [Hymenobacter sp. YIM 151858-1]
MLRLPKAASVGLCSCLLPLISATAQPTITKLSPAANATNVLRTEPVEVTFRQAIGRASAYGLLVHSTLRGGMRVGHTAYNKVTGTHLTCTPDFAWQPGEVITAVVTTAVHDPRGQALKAPWVFQFTTATGGSGRGNFTPPAAGGELAVGSSPGQVVMGDVDNDGDIDLVTSNDLADANSNHTISVRLNNGSGAFSGGGEYAMARPDAGVLNLDMGDVDNDGDLDLVGYTYGANVRQMVTCLNDGRGKFTRSELGFPQVGRFVNAVTLGDIDGDGDLDMVASNSFPPQFDVCKNNGNGVFTTTATLFLTQGAGIASLADVDNDGDLDFLSPTWGTGTVSVLPNDGSGTFSNEARYSVGAGPTIAKTADVDRDGDLDLISANTNSLSVRLNNGRGVFGNGSDVAINPGAHKMEPADVDADGDLDLVLVNQETSQLSVLRNNGSGNFQATEYGRVGSFPTSMAVVDMDGDNDLDVLTANNGASSLSLRMNLGAPLPVELASFTAERRGQAAHLAWTTASERANKGFGVEASLNGQQFRRIGWVPGKGTSTSPTRYQFVDARLQQYASPIVYYRLVQVDADGTERISPTRAITIERVGNLVAEGWPNPFGEQLTVQLQAPQPGKADFVLYDARGVVQLRFSSNVAGGPNQLPLPLRSNLPAGLYWLAVQQAGQQQVLQLYRRNE